MVTRSFGVSLYRIAFMALIVCSLSAAEAADGLDSWAHGNLVAFGVIPFDARQREPEERAQMLERLGYKNFVYSFREKHIRTLDVEIDALKRNGIRLSALMLYVVDDPDAKVDWRNYLIASPDVFMGKAKPNGLTLEDLLKTFRRHNVRPQLWMISYPMNPRAAAETRSADQLSQRMTESMRRDLTAFPQQQRVMLEGDRMNALARLAAPYGVKVEMYNHGGWLGMIDNQIAVIERLKEQGVTDVGMVYDFAHGRDELHDDSSNFPALWKQAKPYVVEVNIGHMNRNGAGIPTTQDNRELEMMRIVQDSGWRGPIGLDAMQGGDAEVALKSALLEFDWLSAELRQPGSGGPLPD
jgi:hypothetical protein